MTKFIKLTRKNGDPIHIVAEHVIALSPNNDHPGDSGTSVTPSTGFTFAVKESVDEALAIVTSVVR